MATETDFPTQSGNAAVAGNREPVCYVRVTGGFGNQLFQYAYARHLHLEHGALALLDVSAYRRAEHMRKAHQRLHLDELEVPVEMVSLPFWRFEAARKLHKLPGSWQRLLTGLEFRKENQQPNWDAGDAYDQLVLNGAWQSPHCFAESSQAICSELRAGLQVGPNTPCQTGVIAFHVRRGDYLDVDYMARLDYQCLLRRAREHFRSNGNGNLRFRIFSDDPQWCREALNGDDVDIHDGGTMLNDFRAMLSCEHNVIANSSFSWWAAYLNPNPNKIVCAPSRWMADRSARESSILPAEWVELDDS